MFEKNSRVRWICLHLEARCQTKVEHGIDGTWIDPELVGRWMKRGDTEHIRKRGVFEVSDVKVQRQRLQSSHADVGGQDER